MSFHGGGKGDFHGDFLADRKVLAGFDKRAAGADIGNRRFEIAIAGLTMGGRQDLGESLTPVISCFDIFYRLFFVKKAEHFKNRRIRSETIIAETTSTVIYDTRAHSMRNTATSEYFILR